MLRQIVILVEGYADVLAIGMAPWVPVVTHVASLSGKDGVVAADVAVVAWIPVHTALAEDDVAGDDVLS